jgi:hypothetical protein
LNGILNTGRLSQVKRGVKNDIGTGNNMNRVKEVVNSIFEETFHYLDYSKVKNYKSSLVGLMLGVEALLVVNCGASQLC